MLIRRSSVEEECGSRTAYVGRVKIKYSVATAGLVDGGPRATASSGNGENRGVLGYLVLLSRTRRPSTFPRACSLGLVFKFDLGGRVDCRPPDGEWGSSRGGGESSCGGLISRGHVWLHLGRASQQVGSLLFLKLASPLTCWFLLLRCRHSPSHRGALRVRRPWRGVGGSRRTGMGSHRATVARTAHGRRATCVVRQRQPR